MKTPIELIQEERQRQIQIGWTLRHDDDEHDTGHLCLAAAAFALNAASQLSPDSQMPLAECPDFWPWAEEHWKPKDPMRDLARAGALIAAEMERLERAKALWLLAFKNNLAELTSLAGEELDNVAEVEGNGWVEEGEWMNMDPDEAAIESISDYGD